MKVLINGVDQTQYINIRTFRIDQALTSEVDSAKFTLTQPAVAPEILQEVIITDNDDNRIFAGVVLNVVLKYDTLMAIHEVSCKDYTELMDGKYVVEDFSNTPLDEIIQSVIDVYLPAGFTLNCQVSQTISFVKFNYLKPSQCLKKLAELVMGDWYVDYNKVIHFIDKTTMQAPFIIMDNNGKMIKQTLQIKKDASQIKNTVYVRGGEYLGAQQIEKFIANGQQAIFNLAYKYSGLEVTLNGSPLSIGIDFISDPESVDVVYNFAEKVIKFREDNTPELDDEIEVKGLPYVPVYVKAEESTSISDYGVKEFKIVDNSIKSKQAAIDRARAEIESYYRELNDGSFQTYQNGLHVGQQIQINSEILGINKFFIINRLSIVVDASNEDRNILKYNVGLTTKEKFDLIQLLQRLLDRAEIGEDKTDEVLEKLYYLFETLTISETIIRRTPKNDEQAITIGEEIRRDPFAIKYVLCPYKVVDENDSKRPFLLDRGRLI